MKRLPSSIMRLSASLLLALALFTNTGCNEGSNVADNNQQPRSIAQQALDNMPADVREALEAKEANEASIMSIDGVNGIGVGLGDDNKARIIVLTEKENVKNIPNTIGGVKVKVEHVGKIEGYGKPGTGGGGKGGSKPAPGYRSAYPTNAIPCGVSIGNNNECAAGTLACVVKDGNGTRYALSNWHVLSGRYANGGTINQPGLYDATTQCNSNGTSQILEVATSQLADIVTGTNSVNYIDAGLGSIKDGITVMQQMADGSTFTTNALDPEVGMYVRKVGRTTGVTTGQIAGIGFTISVAYDHGTAKFYDQIYVASGKFIKSGDSGSLMTTNGAVTGSNNPVGLCFAGSSTASFANPIKAVLDHFDVVISDN